VSNAQSNAVPCRHCGSNAHLHWVCPTRATPTQAALGRQDAPVPMIQAAERELMAALPKFDKVAYQREYMRKWRAKRKATG